MSSSPSLDFIDWADLRELKQSLDQGDQRVRRSVRRIVHPTFVNSVHDDHKVLMHTLRMLAACHDARAYDTQCVDAEYYESDAVFGLRRFTFNGSVLNWELIRHDEAALNYAKALIAVTNLLWAVVTSDPLHPLSSVLKAETEEVWLTSEPVIELVLRHVDHIDLVLNAIDQRHDVDPEEIERIVNYGVLGDGVV